MTTKLDAFTTAYLTAALFTEDPNPGQGEYSEHGEWTIDNIDPESLEEVIAECGYFQHVNQVDIDGNVSHAGRDFWYTRNGHGCGFWDGDWPEDIGERLTREAAKAGSRSLYLGDDGKLYFGEG